MSKPSPYLVIAITALALTACSKKPPEQLPPAPGAEVDTSGGSGREIVKGSQEDFLASITSDHILFDTDRYDVDAEDQAILQSQAQWLARYPGVRITIEGHCDERGTREYNIALGDKRANAAKNYLLSLGVDVSRVSTISYGKERPTALGSDEGAWAQNRRAVTVTVQ